MTTTTRAHTSTRERETSSDANMAGASTRDGTGRDAWDGAMGGEDAKAGRSWATRVDARNE